MAASGGSWRTFSSRWRNLARAMCASPVVSRWRNERCLALLRALCDRGFRVSLETSGALSVEAVDPRVSRVVDVKTPESGEEQRNLYAQLQTLKEPDQIKFVICSRADYEWSRAKLRELALAERCGVLFSPSYGAARAARAGGMDPRRPPAGALPGAAAQDPVGRGAWPLSAPWCCSRAASTRRPRSPGRASKATSATRYRSPMDNATVPSLRRPRGGARAAAREHRLMHVDLGTLGELRAHRSDARGARAGQRRASR